MESHPSTPTRSQASFAHTSPCSRHRSNRHVPSNSSPKEPLRSAWIDMRGDYVLLVINSDTYDSREVGQFHRSSVDVHGRLSSHWAATAHQGPSVVPPASRPCDRCVRGPGRRGSCVGDCRIPHELSLATQLARLVRARSILAHAGPDRGHRGDVQAQGTRPNRALCRNGLDRADHLPDVPGSRRVRRVNLTGLDARMPSASQRARPSDKVGACERVPHGFECRYLTAFRSVRDLGEFVQHGGPRRHGVPCAHGGQCLHGEPPIDSDLGNV